MRLNIRAMVFALAILWGLIVFFTALVNLMWSGYGTDFLKILSSLYPGYKASGTFGDLIIGVIYALVDGGVIGLILAWIYNLFLGRPSEVTEDEKHKAGVNYSPIEPKA